jgi:hypothetical protein
MAARIVGRLKSRQPTAISDNVVVPVAPPEVEGARTVATGAATVRRKKTTRAERAKRKAEARKQDRLREKIERQIALGTVKIIPWEEATIRVLGGEQLPEDVLVEAPPDPPAIEFLCRRLRHVPVDQVDAALKQAVTELLSSNTPMSAHERQDFEDLRRQLKSQRRPRKISPAVRAQAYEGEINALVRRGYTAGQAKEKVIEALKSDEFFVFF